MEVSSNLLKLKLDMVYRDLPIEAAEKRFAEATAAPADAEAPAPEPIAVRAIPKRKAVKALVPKNK